MSGPGLGPFFQNLEAQVNAKGGYQATAQEHYESYSAELDNFISGGAQRRIYYDQSGHIWLAYKLIYALLFTARSVAGIWSMIQDNVLNQEHWLGILTVVTLISGCLLLLPLLQQLTAAPRMTPVRFKNASIKLRQYALLDAILLLLIGGITLILTIIKDYAPSTFLSGFLLLFASLCSCVIFALEQKRKLQIIEPKA